MSYFYRLYEEYSIMQGFLRMPELRKERRVDQHYNTLLTSFVNIASSDSSILTRLLLEAPAVTEVVLDQLKQICRDETRCNWAMSLLKDLILRRPTRQAMLLEALLENTTNASQNIRDCATTYVLELYKNNVLENDIVKFVIKYLEYLHLPSPPEVLFGQEKMMNFEGWTDDVVKACIHPYMALVPVKQTLIHNLTKVYVQTGPDMKRIILKQLEGPVKQMGMESHELLQLVEECDKGAETLVTRIIQILTDKGAPSERLVHIVRDLYNTKVNDVRFLIPVLNGLSKKEVRFYCKLL